VRYQTLANRQAIERSAVRSAHFLFLDFADGAARLNSSPLDIVAFGETWLGGGSFAGFTGLVEDTQLRGMPVEIAISGVDPALVPTLRTADFRGRAAQIYEGYFSQDWTLLAPPEVLFSGVMDHARYTVSATEARVSLVCESAWAYFYGRPIPIKYTNEEQQRRYAGDRFFEFLPAQFDMNIDWGGKILQAGGARPGDFNQFAERTEAF
jgi:hypothetical protein